MAVGSIGGGVAVQMTTLAGWAVVAAMAVCWATAAVAVAAVSPIRPLGATTTRATRQFAGNGVAVPLASASAVSIATLVAAAKTLSGRAVGVT